MNGKDSLTRLPEAGLRLGCPKPWAGLLTVCLVLAMGAAGPFFVASAAGSQPAASTGKAGVNVSTDGDVLTIANQYIAILVNNGASETGRFAINTTGGDPERTGDEDATLIYGYPAPWTSYTTVRVDGKDYIFGGKTAKRAGKSGLFGTVIDAPTVAGDAVKTAWQLGPLCVTQVLSFADSTTTGLGDTARISYTVQNTDSASHEVGLRVMLDTMLGENDGAPFRFGEKAVTTDTAYVGAEIPAFFQAFDTLTEPKVTAQGTLRDASVTEPSRLYVSNWGSLADGPWDTDFTPGRDFTRKGEFGLDSAIALYWDPTPLAAGESRTYSTLYGLGGITIVSGELVLGVTSPARVLADARRPAEFPVVAYVQNAGQGAARNVVASLTLPAGLALAPGEQAREVLGKLAPGETGQASWKVVATGQQTGKRTFSVTAEAANAKPNTVERSVVLVSPPSIAVTLKGPETAGFSPDAAVDAFTVQAVIENRGGAPAHWLDAKLDLGASLAFAPGEKSRRYLYSLEPGEAQTLTWLVAPVFGAGGQSRYTVQVRSNDADPAGASRSVAVVPGKQQVYLAADQTVVQQGHGYFTVDVVGLNIDSFAGIRFGAVYDPTKVQVFGVSRGPAFAPAGDYAGWGPPMWDNGVGRLTGARGTRHAADLRKDVLASIHFVPVGPGKVTIALIDVQVTIGQKTVTIDVAPIVITIGAR